MKSITIYSDGACSGNPGPGGYGVVMVAGERRLELARGFRRTTNNRMEILAVIAGLEALKRPSRVEVVSDSQYVVNAIQKGWLASWRRNGWRKADKSPAANVDLWERLLRLLERHQVRFSWVRGHDGHEENERADQLAVGALRGEELEVDAGFERE